MLNSSAFGLLISEVGSISRQTMLQMGSQILQVPLFPCPLPLSLCLVQALSAHEGTDRAHHTHMTLPPPPPPAVSVFMPVILDSTKALAI